MKSKSEDIVDLGPYFSLLMKMFYRIRTWFLGRRWIILILFFLLLLIRFMLPQFRGETYVSQGVIDSGVIPSETIRSILNSLKSSSQQGLEFQELGFDVQEQNADAMITSIDFKVFQSLKDSLLISSNGSENSQLDQVQFDEPIHISIGLNVELDSVGYHFIELLRSHVLVRGFADHQKMVLNRRLKSLLEEISEVDSITKYLLNVEQRSLAYDQTAKVFESKNNVIYDLIRYRGDLIISRDTIQDNLAMLDEDPILTIAEFSSPSKVQVSFPTNTSFFIKTFLITLVIVIFFDFFMSKIQPKPSKV